MSDIDRRRGKYVARWREPDGRQRSKSFARATDARRFLAEVQVDLSHGTYVDHRAGTTPLAEYAGTWLAGVKAGPSREVYERHLRVHILPALGTMPLAAIKPSRVAQFVAGLEISPTYAGAILITLSAVLSAAVADGLIHASPCASVKPPKVTQARMEPWTPEQVARVRSLLPERYRAMVDCGAGLGLRISEVLGLRVADVDFLRRVVHVRQQVRRVGGQLQVSPPKGGKARDVPLPAVVGERLAAHLAVFGGSTEIFTAPAGGMISRAAFGHTWDRATVAAGLGRGHGFHQLRHTFASVLLAGGVDVRALSEALGHSDPGFTLRVYAHVMPSAPDRIRSAIDRALECAPDVREQA